MKEERIFIVAGLGFGDEGKGSVVDFLAKRYKVKLIIRHNGGSQAAHFVLTSDGILHCFSQFGSGTFAGARTYLSDKMLVDPIRLKDEANVLKKKGIKNPFKLISIDPDCLVITPFHGIINRMLEISRKGARHGSCGFGVGETVKDGRKFGQMALVARDFLNKKTLLFKLDYLWRAKIDIAEQLVDQHPNDAELSQLLKKLREDDYVERLASFYYNFAKKSGVAIRHIKENALGSNGNIIFEGAQGVLLDEERGFYPHITHSRTTFKNAEEKIRNARSDKKTTRIAVIRAYSTRHGAGPFVAEDEWLTREIPDHNNLTNEWQGAFRIGWFDLVAAKYALQAAGKVDCVALTNFDRLNFEKIKVCEAYEYSGKIDGTLKEYFELEKINERSIITKIKFPSETSFEYQGRLAELLKLCKPVYREVEKRNYIRFLERELKINISIVSNGATAGDKIELRPL